MKGIIKAIKNDIYIHKREYGNSTIGFYTVAGCLMVSLWT